jgi:hypothetical protein
MVPPRLVVLHQPTGAVCIKLNYLSKLVIQTSALPQSCSHDVPWKKSNGRTLSTIKDENSLITVSIRTSGSGLP